jgi:hypothetical protein
MLCAELLCGDIDSSSLAAALQQHPQYTLRAIEAAVRQPAATPREQMPSMGFSPQRIATMLPLCSWFVGSVASPQFWSGAESDDLAAHVASLLRTCFKINSSDPQRFPGTGTLFTSGEMLATFQIYAQTAGLGAGSSGSSNSSATEGNGSSSSRSSSRSLNSLSKFSGDRIVQLSSCTDPCPQPLLQLASLWLINFGQALDVLLQRASRGYDFAYMLLKDGSQPLFNGLGHVRWLGPQLQQLLLPGDPRKAAAALQGLQEQQQQLQQVLWAALWRLNAFAAAIEQSSTHRASASTPDVDVDALANSRPEGLLDLADLYPAGMCRVTAYRARRAAALVDRELPQQLQQLGSALWSALPQPRCCNSVACANLGSISEAKLVAGRASRCSKCKAAK